MLVINAIIPLGERLWCSAGLFPTLFQSYVFAVSMVTKVFNYFTYEGNEWKAVTNH